MFKFTVIRLRDIVKITMIVIIVCMLCRVIFNIYKKRQEIIKFDLSNFIRLGIDNESSIIKSYSRTNITEEKTEEVEETAFNKKIKTLFKTGTNIFNSKSIAKIEENITNTDVPEKIENQEQEETSTSLECTVVTPDPIKESYDLEYNGVKIKNETSYELTDEILNSNDLNINGNNIIIFHTHTCEGYTPSENYYYESENYRTQDLNYTVSKVGDELTNYLGTFGFNVNHNSTYHDYPSYTGSYNRSLSTVEGILQNFSSDIIIDLHRDAIGSKNTYAPTVKIGDDYCSQLMFVTGTNGGGLYHPNWSTNLKFAIKVQEKANEIYPRII